MFAWWGRVVVRLRWAVLVAGVGVVVLGATFGLGLFGDVSGGGFDDPNSESSRAAARIEREFGPQGADVLVLYSSPSSTVDDPAFKTAVIAALDRADQLSEVDSVTSFYDGGTPSLVSADRHATYAVIQIAGGVNDGTPLSAMTSALQADGLTTEVGGLMPFITEVNEQVEADIVRAELLSLPLLLILLVFIFRGLVAAATPLLVGGLAILGAFVATRLIAQVTEISTFAVNVITMLGLGMAIDYALFVVSRFREELAAGRDVPAAIATTLATAGRTVMVSGLIVALALASLLIFPMAFLRSMGWGGMAAVLVAMLAALTVLPALLAVLGHRINALSLRRRTREAASTTTSTTVVSAERATAGTSGAWARLARGVMRRPVWYAVAVIALLGALASPFLRAEFGGFDERILPKGTPSRTVAERIAAEFPGGSTAPIQVLVAGAPVEAVQRFADEIAALPDVTGAQLAGNDGEDTLVSVSYAGSHTGTQARDVVGRIRELPPPDGAEILVGGRSAADRDLLASLGERLPWMALLMGGVTMVLLFLAFGSVLLPVKAVLMSLVSIGASFGVVVWVFQDGHLSGWLGFTATGFLEPTDLILMLAVLFGLSTDYEVFLLSRIREEWDRTGDNNPSVAAGMQRTGGIITAAALLLIIVVGGFAAGGTVSIKLLGVGMMVAIAVDALLVRALLVPATMRLLGRWNWWAPGPLAKVYRRYGIHETLPAPARADEPVRLG